MAKRTLSSSLKGNLDMVTGTITSVTKDSIKTYDLKKELNEYDGLDISINITQVENISPMGDDELEDVAE